MSREKARVPLSHRLEYMGFRLFRGLLRVLPLRAALAVGSLLGWLAGSVLRVRRHVVDANLARAFPQVDLFIAGGGKWLKTTRVQAAWSATKVKGSYLQAQFHRIRARRFIRKTAANRCTISSAMSGNGW